MLVLNMIPDIDIEKENGIVSFNKCYTDTDPKLTYMLPVHLHMKAVYCLLVKYLKLTSEFNKIKSLGVRKYHQKLLLSYVVKEISILYHIKKYFKGADC